MFQRARDIARKLDVEAAQDVPIDSTAVNFLGKLLGPEKKSESMGTFFLWMAGVAGIAALADKLLGFDFLSGLPSLDDIKVAVGISEPKTEKVEAPVPLASTPQVKAKMMPSSSEDLNASIDLSKVKVVGPSTEVMDIIQNAASLVGIDASLMLAIAHQESKFKTSAKASGSSAQGLLQLVSGTWKELVSKYGKQYGITLADIKVPEKNAILGACYIKSLMVDLEKKLGKPPSVTDIYAGFVLGSFGARKLLDALKDAPSTVAASILPNAAKSNKNIFYHKDGKAKTVSEVYATLYGSVGAQYLKFAETTKAAPTLAAASSFTLPLPDLSTSGDSAKPATVKVAASSSQIASDGNSKPVEVAFNVPPVPDMDAQMEDATVPKETGAIAMIPKAEDSPTDFYKTPSGRLVMIG